MNKRWIEGLIGEMEGCIIRRAEQSRAEQSRAVYIEFLRIIACVMVIFNHTNERGFYRYVYDVPGSMIAIWNLFVSISVKSAVPIFFMISGTMLLGKEESICTTYKRIIKIVIDLVFFSVLYFFIECFNTKQFFSVQEVFSAIIQSQYWHLWYLYAYIAFIIALPILRDLAKNIKLINSLLLYIVSVMILGIVPIVEYFFMPINSLFKPAWITENIFIYPILGYIIDRKIDIKRISRLHIYAMWMINTMAFFISEVCEYFLLVKEPGNATETFLCNFTILNAPILFITVKWIFEKHKVQGYIYRIVTEIGKCTFGIYLLHIIFLWKIPLLYKGLTAFEQGSVFCWKFGILFSCIIVFVITGIITFFLRKIPVIKRLL